MHAALGLPNYIRNDVKAWDFISAEVIHSGEIQTGARNHFEILTDFVFVLASQRRRVWVIRKQ